MGEGSARVRRWVLIEHGISNVKGSASEEAFGAARYERVGLGCRRTWRNGGDLSSCASAVKDQRSRRHSGSGS